MQAAGGEIEPGKIEGKTHPCNLKHKIAVS